MKEASKGTLNPKTSLNESCKNARNKNLPSPYKQPLEEPVESKISRWSPNMSPFRCTWSGLELLLAEAVAAAPVEQFPGGFIGFRV